jgi:hypothetical protein
MSSKSGQKLVTAYTRNPATVGLMNSVLIHLSPVSNTILMAPYAAQMPHAEEVAFRTYAHLNRYGDNGLYRHHDPADLPYGQAFATLKEQYPVLQHPGNALVLAGARQGSALEQSIYETRDYNFCGAILMAEKDATVKILMIAATHGNELLGIKLYQRLLQKRSPLLEHINFMIGNPRAFAAKKRYIDCDLNRSYGVNGQLYEQQRAAEIAAYISETKPDIVLDMHTTSCIQPNCLIVGNLDGAAKRRLLAASHITTILAVQPMNDVATLGNNVVGYEIPNR